MFALYSSRLLHSLKGNHMIAKGNHVIVPNTHEAILKDMGKFCGYRTTIQYMYNKMHTVCIILGMFCTHVMFALNFCPMFVHKCPLIAY